MSSKPATKRAPAPGFKAVHLPLEKTRLSRLIYILVLLSALFLGFYAYRLTQWKTDAETGRPGSLWHFGFGSPKPTQTPNLPEQHGQRTAGPAAPTVENQIKALAVALGMPSSDLARAIAAAVRAYVPPASLSSVKEKETGSPIVEELFKEANQAGTAAVADSTGVLNGVLEGIDKLVGMDEP